MPTYTFRDTNNASIFTEFMSMSEREKYLVDNPHIIQEFTLIPIVDPVRIGITKPDAAFQKHVLGRIKAANGGADSYVGDRHFSIPSEI